MDEASSGGATGGAEFDDPVGRGDDIEVMFDDDDGGAFLDELIQDIEEASDIEGVEACCGFIEDEEGARGGRSGQLRRELDALSFTPGEGERGASEGEIAQANVLEGVQSRGDGGYGVKERESLVHAELEDLGDRQALELDFEGLGIEASTLAGFTGDDEIGQELHGDGAGTVTLAGFATPPGLIQGETAGREAADPRFAGESEESAQLVEEPGVGRGVGARGPAQGGLIDEDHAIESFETPDRVMSAWSGHGKGLRSWSQSEGGPGEDVENEGAFSRATWPGHRGEACLGDVDIDVFQVVV
jgi:hypothetical protein